MRSPSPRPGAERASDQRAPRTFAAVFLIGPLLAEAWLVLPHSSTSDDAAVLAVCVAAQLFGACLLSRRVDRIPDWVLHALVPLGTLMISAAYYFTGDPFSGFAFFYLWVVPYAFVFFTRRYAAVQVVFAALCLGVVVVLQAHGEASFQHSADEAAGRWVLAVGTLILVGMFARRLSGELGDSAQRYREMIEGLPVVTYVAEPGATGSWQYVSPQIAALLGYSPEEWASNPDLWAERLHPDDRDRVLAAEDVACRNRITLDLEYRIYTRDGDVRWVRDRATPRIAADGSAVFDGLLADITDQRRAEAAKTAIVESALDAIVTIDHRGDVIEFNPAAQRIFGYTREEAIGESLAELVVPPTAREAHQGGLERAAANNALTLVGQRLRMTAMRADGSEFPVELTLTRHGDDPPTFTGFVRDVTDSERAQEGLRRSEALLAQAQAQAHIGSWEWEPATGEATWSAEMYRILGLDPDSFEPGYDGFMERLHPDDRGEALATASRAIADGRPWSSERRIVRADGQVRVVHIRGEAALGEDGKVVRLSGFLQDVTERRQAELAQRESHDRLQAIIDGSPSLIYVKDREYRYLLANRRLEELWGFKPGGIVGRTDGEIVPPQAVERIRADDRRVFTDGEVMIQEEVLPVSGIERVYLTQKFPLRRPDGEIYAVGGVSTDITERRAEERELRDEVEWSNRVRHALKADGLVLHAQPIVAADSGEVCQEELLVRMRSTDDPEQLLAPGLFLPAAERSGLVTEIDRWVISHAIARARHRRVEVNLSGRSIGDPSLLELIEQEMNEQRVDPGMLIVEITETTAVQDLGAAREFASRLKELGCGFALDDFGTGFGSFTYLKTFPVDYLKIDMEFVRDLEADESNSQLISAIVGVAQAFGIRTIAEGVEEEPTLELLRELGVDYFQGYLLGRPAPLEDLDVGVVPDHEAVRLR